MTTPAGGIEPDTEADEATTFMGLAPEVRRRMWQVAMTPEPRDPGYIDEPGYAFFNDALKRCEGLASTATASPQSPSDDELVTMARNAGIGIVCGSILEQTLNDKLRRFYHAAVESQFPSEHPTERSALQPEAPCEDLADARRYRWLREPHDIKFPFEVFPTIPWVSRMVRERDLPTVVGINGPELDAAIDAAMKERP